MSSPRMPSAVRGGGGGAAPSPPDHDSYTSALSPTVASFDEGPGAAFSAFHRRRTSTSNPTRRRSSLMQEPMSGDSRSNSSTRRSSNGHPPPSPSTGSSGVDWLSARRALSTQQERKRSKSDDEREPDDAPLRSTASPASNQHLHPRSAMPASISISTNAPSSANNEAPERLLPARAHSASIPPVLSPLPIPATVLPTSATPSELLPLPQDPNHILPLSTPPPSFRESLDYVGHASSGHGSTPRTSLSASEEMSWGTGTRSYSDSSAGDDDDSPTTTSGWWWRAHGRPPPVRPMLRKAPSRLPFGIRRWGWLLAPFNRMANPREYEYTALLSGGASSNGGSSSSSSSRKRGGYDRERIYLTTTRRKPRTVFGSEYLAQAADFVQNEPWAVVLFLFVFAIFAVCLGCSIKYILDPDKAALPWREYAMQDYPTVFSIQDADWDNDALGGYLPPLSVVKPLSAQHELWPYPGYDYAPHRENLHGGPRVDDLEPTTVYVAVFTYDVGVDRRNLIRQSYASHPRSRTPGTEGVRLRFIMGRPRPQFKHMVDAEVEEYEDIVILDTDENMNQGKTYTFLSWAADNATVPDYEYPSYPRSEASALEFAAQRERGEEPMPIYRGEKKPDYIAKADDDAFIMLGELERHLRVTPRNKTYWGYLVRERFMAGECYALSRDLVEYIRDTEDLRDHIHGKEDKLVSKWLRTHPDKEKILWFSERTWIYDHPKAGTVYSHGFLFPDEVARVRAERSLSFSTEADRRPYPASADAFSTVSHFGHHYRPPLRGLSFDEAAEALVEGSAMSKLRDEAGTLHAHTRADMAERVDALMAAKPTFAQRYLGDPHLRGGTVVVHYIKRRMWFDETRRTLLGED
ncbi:hypothetical protein CC85DRAFT_259945 [Cutaneotrichosporon oleaginosum]|uniref:Glycosyltransferase family 31 protein n=1 Tax=Cutaneotrichosporon oleaginosum TaxID=879819 RepID=A0A0J1B4Z0_9TREE|nr:uncharacterized protein CC85DRAFT_259945 [Cutaneotrichosporon oleaginosum]KLT42759.1 hypothetical protein CC85DRAFT_259945 [Cutaneotrichosporon oleaginosum]TXT09523.1 hypothetical protein COLE_03457 [Cutaneotrichosporon oleaginosum]